MRRTFPGVMILGLGIAAMLALLFGSCSVINPPPAPPPTPPPPATCPETCPLGQECTDGAIGCVTKPVKYPEREVRKCEGSSLWCVGGQPIDFAGCIECCLPWEDGWGGWPMVSTEFVDWGAAGNRCKDWHRRPGPFAAADEAWATARGIGGSYVEVGDKADLTRFNPAFFDYNERVADHICSIGGRFQDDVIDGWRLKNGCPYSPWNAARNVQGEDHCTLTPGDPVQDAWIRQVVGSWGRYACHTWQISNESRNIGPREKVVAWERWVAERIRHWEREVGSGVVSPIVTNSALEEVESAGWVDGVVRHSIQYAPIAGKPTECNEINPAPANYAAEFCKAKEGGAYLWVWRAELTRPQFDAALAGVLDVRLNGCSGALPPPVACVDESKLVGDSCSSEMYGDEVLAATTKLGFLGPDCKKNLKALAAELARKTGKCAIGGIEAVFIARPEANIFEENHACFFGDGTWTNSGRGKFMGCHQNTAPPPPSANGCTAPLPPKVGRFNLKPHLRINDSTPLFYGKEATRWDGSTVNGYCATWGMADKLWCPARNEGDPERAACEALGVSGKPYGAPMWRSDGEVYVTDNPYQAICRTPCTWLEVCAADGTSCARCQIDPVTNLCKPRNP